MKTRTVAIFWIAVIIIGLAAFFFLKTGGKGASNKVVIRQVKPVYGRIQTTVTATAIVQPQNRLEIKPSISGRIDQILVKEGEIVKKGQVLAYMSSMERAALLDAALGRGPDAEEYWSQVYKQVPMTAPIDGEVIVRAVEPGQSVTENTAVLVLSDRLIVNAQIDETDIGKIKIGQPVTITLDAYPQAEIKATVDHIAYESQTVNNVTIYEVEILPEKVPDFFRSGMSANVEIVEQDKENVLLIPNEAVIKEDQESFVRVAGLEPSVSELRKIRIGVMDDINSEVVSGLGPNDTVIIETQVFSLPKDSTGSNPFMPSSSRRR